MVEIKNMAMFLKAHGIVQHYVTEGSKGKPALVFANALRDADLTEKTPKINKPTLVLCGDQDIATPPDLGRELAQAIPGARFSLIKEAAHLTCIEQPEAMAQQMREFFRDARIV